MNYKGRYELYRRGTWRHQATRLLLASVLALLAGYAVGVAQASDDWSAVEKAMGRSGTLLPDGTFRFNMPRTDLEVVVRGVTLRPAFALGSWVHFKRTEKGALAMGDLVLTTDEVNPVILQLQEGGVEQTALHNHVLDESPRIMYLHIHGEGDPVEIARAARAALDLTGTPLSGGAPSGSLDLDTEEIDRILGHSGRVNNGVYQFSIPRAEAIREHDIEIPPSMGVATAINFQPTGDGNAAITGDFVLRAHEVNPVIRALRRNGIEVTALHSHMLEDRPRLFFMHFWANEDALQLAQGLREALDETHSK